MARGGEARLDKVVKENDIWIEEVRCEQRIDELVHAHNWEKRHLLLKIQDF